MSFELDEERDSDVLAHRAGAACSRGVTETEGYRRILSGFNHRCRNSLNGIKLGLYLFKRQMDGPTPKFWGELERTYQEMERLFDWLQLIYRPPSLHLVRSPLGRLVGERLPTWRAWLVANGLDLEVAPPLLDEAGDFDPMHLGLALDALVKWRAEVLDPEVRPRLAWRFDQDRFELSWSEGFSAGGGARRSAPAKSAAARPSGAAPLALPLLNRMIAAHRGSLYSREDPALSLKLCWPRFQSEDNPGASEATSE
jgi:hypothetical protein